MKKKTKEEQFLEAWVKYQPFGPAGMPEQQVRFTREGDEDYRFDFAWPKVKVAVEVQGLGYGHQRVAGIKRDAHKARLAIEYGWTLFPVTTPCMGSEADRELIVWQVSNAIIEKGNQYESIHAQACTASATDERTPGDDSQSGHAPGSKCAVCTGGCHR